MNKFLIIVLLAVLSGCASVNVPSYIQDKYPYKRTFYAPFDKIHELTVRALENSGWTVHKESDPALFEQGREIGVDGLKQTLVFTKISAPSFTACSASH